MVNGSILLIFDIDGTLTDSAGITRIALERAAMDIYGVEHTTLGITAWGQTDFSIFEKMVSNNHLPVDDLHLAFASFSLRYIEHLNDLLFASDKPRLHTGVKSLLDRLSRERDVKLALGTGNIHQTAMLKLKRHRVDHHFPVGGFGSDSSDRPSLLKVALERSRAYYSEPFPIGSYWVIGDTPNDIRSGKTIGAETVAVCTGFHPPGDLARLRPTALLPDLSDADFFLALVRREIEPENGQANLFSESIGEEPDPL